MSWALIPLTEQQKEIQQLAREFARSEIAPHCAEWDRDAAMDPAILARLAALGFLGMMVPEQYEGLGLDTVTYLVALEEIAAVDASVAVAMSVHNSLPTQMILRYGSDAQRQRFLPPMARGESLCAFALSEPEAARTRRVCDAAVRDGDTGFSTGRSVVHQRNQAGVILAMARTDRPGMRRGARVISAFIVTPELEGFARKKEDKLGCAASPTVQLSFDHMRVSG